MHHLIWHFYLHQHHPMKLLFVQTHVGNKTCYSAVMYYFTFKWILRKIESWRLGMMTESCTSFEVKIIFVCYSLIGLSVFLYFERRLSKSSSAWEVYEINATMNRRMKKQCRVFWWSTGEMLRKAKKGCILAFYLLRQND